MIHMWRIYTRYICKIAYTSHEDKLCWTLRTTIKGQTISYRNLPKELHSQHIIQNNLKQNTQKKPYKLKRIWNQQIQSLGQWSINETTKYTNMKKNNQQHHHQPKTTTTNHHHTNNHRELKKNHKRKHTHKTKEQLEKRTGQPLFLSCEN